jgi:hypothetical protein
MPREDRRHQAYAELVADLHEVAIALIALSGSDEAA